MPSAAPGAPNATPTTTSLHGPLRAKTPSNGSRSQDASGSPCCSSREPSTPQ
jgi:hypothetical protein